MARLTLSDVIEKIIDRIDPDDLLEILDVDIETLVDRLEDIIEANHSLLESYFYNEGY